jgi:hypothetical protein
VAVDGSRHSGRTGLDPLAAGKTRAVTTEDTFTVDPWCLREPRLDLDVRNRSHPRQRQPRCARNPGRGRAGRQAGHLPGWCPRAAHDGLHRDRQRRPGGHRDPGQHHRRHRRPAPGRRPPARRAHRDPAGTTSGSWTSAPAPSSASCAGGRRSGGPSTSPPPGSCRWTSAGSSRCATRCAPSTSRWRSCCSRAWSPTSSRRTCRRPSPPRTTSSSTRSTPRSTPRTAAASHCCTAPSAPACWSAPRPTTTSRPRTAPPTSTARASPPPTMPGSPSARGWSRASR